MCTVIYPEQSKSSEFSYPLAFPHLCDVPKSLLFRTAETPGCWLNKSQVLYSTLFVLLCALYVLLEPTQQACSTSYRQGQEVLYTEWYHHKIHTLYKYKPVILLISGILAIFGAWHRHMHARMDGPASSGFHTKFDLSIQIHSLWQMLWNHVAWCRARDRSMQAYVCSLYVKDWMKMIHKCERSLKR